jgi:formylglycine-generating enzyme required for sulfatase activity
MLKRRYFIVGVVLLAAAIATWFWLGRQTAQRASRETLHCALPSQGPQAPHPGMVWVPGGSFEFGDTENPEEQPIRKTTVAGLWMDRTEVTNDEFAEFVKATGYLTGAERPVDTRTHPGLPPAMQQPGAVVFVMPNDVNGHGDVTQWWRYIAGANWRHPGGPATSIEGRGAFPVVTVTYEDAQAYARWKGHSLPTEAQWEWAARAGQPKAAQDHAQPKQANTWQGLFPVVNSGEDGFVGLAPVGCYAPNALGLFDMIGNAWELTADAYAPFHPDPTAVKTPTKMAASAPGQRVIKGGSFLCAPNYCMRYRSGSRQPQEDDLGTSHLGFRTLLIAP